jgi:HSP20 family protein
MSDKDIISREDSDFRMPVQRRELAPLQALQQEVDRLFNEFFDQSSWFPMERRQSFHPRINVTERENEFEVTVELPGIEEKDIDLTMERDTLTIKGEKKVETEEKGSNFYRLERSHGQFCRTIPMPLDVVDQDDVSAIFKNGVLTVTLPKREEVQQISKRISVKQA